MRDENKMNICKNKRNCAKISAGKTAEIISKKIRRKGFSNIVVSAGISQYQMLHELSKADIEWRKVNVFQLDDYVGIPRNHPASFGKFLMDSFDNKIRNLKRFTYINGDASPDEECRRLNRIISRVDIDVACIGIGENGHLGFNDPPADFKIDKPYITVGVDEEYRKQLVGEEWFKTLNAVPDRAITMSVRQIMRSKAIVCTVTGKHKAKIVKNVVDGKVTDTVPASILKRHRNCGLFLDDAAAGQIKSSVASR